MNVTKKRTRKAARAAYRYALAPQGVAPGEAQPEHLSNPRTARDVRDGQRRFYGQPLVRL